MRSFNITAPSDADVPMDEIDRALLNRAALQAVGYTRDTPQPPGGEIQRDRQGNPTGMLACTPAGRPMT